MSVWLGRSQVWELILFTALPNYSICYTLVIHNSSNSLSRHLKDLFLRDILQAKRRGKLLSAFGYLQCIWGLHTGSFSFILLRHLQFFTLFLNILFPRFDLLLLLRSKLPVFSWKCGNLKGCRLQLRFKWNSENQLLHSIPLYIEYVVDRQTVCDPLYPLYTS